ncbi:hypothetical protein REPUB_Repub08aG0216000 [Reevesia pubescens]
MKRALAVKKDLLRELRNSLSDLYLPNSETKINICSKDSASETEQWAKNPLVQIFVNNFSKEGPSTRYRKKLRELRTQKYKQITKLAAKNRRLREEKAKIKEMEALLQAKRRQNGISASKFERDVEPIGYFLEQLHANANANVKSEVDISTFKHPEIFLEKLDANVKSQVDYSDFKFLEKDLGNDLRMVGEFNFPSSLAPILERITETFGDITSDSLQSDCGAMPSYVMFCAAIKEMDDLKLEQVDETKIFLWRDAINSALNVQFKVDFAIEHLKKIARAYFGFKAMEEKSNEELKMIDGTVRKIEVPEDYLREAKYFWGKPLSTGLFH